MRSDKGNWFHCHVRHADFMHILTFEGILDTRYQLAKLQLLKCSQDIGLIHGLPLCLLAGIVCRRSDVIDEDLSALSERQ